MHISLHRLEWRAAAGVCSPPERSATRCRRPRRPRAAAGGSRRPEGRLDPLDRGAVLASALHFPQIPHDWPVSPPQSTISCRCAMLTGAVASCWESWEGSWAREELWAGFGCAAAWPWRCSRSGLSQPASHIMENYGTGGQIPARTRARAFHQVHHGPPRRCIGCGSQ